MGILRFRICEIKLNSRKDRNFGRKSDFTGHLRVVRLGVGGGAKWERRAEGGIPSSTITQGGPCSVSSRREHVLLFRVSVTIVTVGPEPLSPPACAVHCERKHPQQCIPFFSSKRTTIPKRHLGAVAPPPPGPIPVPSLLECVSDPEAV